MDPDFMSDFSIYALKDPRDASIRYVGMTYNLAQRFKSHLMEKRATHKGSWISSLKIQGLEPVLDVLQGGLPSEKDAFEAERKWIAALRSAGAKLTNHTDGGEGAPGYNVKKSERHRLNIAAARIGRKHTSATCAKMAASKRGVSKSRAHRENIAGAVRQYWANRKQAASAASNEVML